MIEVNCGSILEAQRRCIILALLTYSLKHQTFITFITKSQMEQGFFLSMIRDQWSTYQIDFTLKEDGKESELEYGKQLGSKNYIVTEKDQMLQIDQNLIKHSLLTNTDRISYLLTHPPVFPTNPLITNNHQSTNSNSYSNISISTATEALLPIQHVQVIRNHN